jgi:hypothetical protein
LLRRNEEWRRPGGESSPDRNEDGEVTAHLLHAVPCGRVGRAVRPITRPPWGNRVGRTTPLSWDLEGVLLGAPKHPPTGGSWKPAGRRQHFSPTQRGRSHRAWHRFARSSTQGLPCTAEGVIAGFASPSMLKDFLHADHEKRPRVGARRGVRMPYEFPASLLVGMLVSSAESKHEQGQDGPGIDEPKDQLLQRSHLLFRAPL